MTYRPDVYGLVEGPADAPEALVLMALTVECPDCNVNVFLERCESDSPPFPGWLMTVAHDETCPWLHAREQPSG